MAVLQISIDTVICGRNGDHAGDRWYTEFETWLAPKTVLAYKHLFGEHPTAAAFGLYTATMVYQDNAHLDDFVYSGNLAGQPEKMLIYNQYKGNEHGVILVERPSTR